MRVIVIGAGLLGVSTAYFLSRAGHQVTVVERRETAGLETSFANSGMVTPSQADPWNSPGILRKLLPWSGEKFAPILFKPAAMPSLLGWAGAFLRHSSPSRFRLNLQSNVALAGYSLATFDRVRDEENIQYDQLSRGTLKLYRNEESFNNAVAVSETLRDLGVNFEILDKDGLKGREPALSDIASELSGGMFYPDDESGDAHRFCQGLMQAAAVRGVEFLFGARVTDIRHAGGRISAVVTPGRVLTAEAYVLAAGSYSVPLCRKLGLELPVRPVKGYSITTDRGGWSTGPHMPVIDDSLHVAVTPLGQRLRIAGMAEFAGYDTRVPLVRIQRLLGILEAIYPGFSPYRNAAVEKHWAGLRPYCCDGVPVIGPAGFRNLYLNTGHGHLGWTLSVGSGRLLADIMSGMDTDIDPHPYRFDRF